MNRHRAAGDKVLVLDERLNARNIQHTDLLAHTTTEVTPAGWSLRHSPLIGTLLINGLRLGDENRP